MSTRSFVASPPRLRSIWLVAFGLLGIYGSFMLVKSELDVLGDPEAALSCDINPLLACSDSLLTPQAHLLGISNSLIGLMAFTALAAFAVVLSVGVRLPRWIWWGLALGVTVGFLYVLYFLYLSVTIFHALCPYCMLTWVAAVGAFVIVWVNVLAEGLVGNSLVRTGKSVGRYWFLSVVGTLLLFLLVIVLALQTQIASLL